MDNHTSQPQPNEFRVLLTGGGTGGHVYPLLAVAEELRRLTLGKSFSLVLHYMGAAGDYKKVFEDASIPVHHIFESKIRRYFSLLNLLEVFRFLLGLCEAFGRVFRFMPDIVFSKGGPSAFPVILAARFYRIPVIVHESDTVPSLTTRLSARFARVVGVSFPSAAQYLGRGKRDIILFGNPIRREFFENAPTQEDAKKRLGFTSDKKLIVVMGGSQGATRINTFILDSLANLVQDFLVFQITGTKNYETVKKESSFLLRHLPDDIQRRYVCVGYVSGGMATVYSAADLVVSRSGAGSIFEIGIFGKPSILIPLPESAADHQRRNAYEYMKLGGARVLEEANFLPHVFLNEIKRILENDDVRGKMIRAAGAFSKPDAASNLALLIIQLGGYGG